MLKVTIYMLLKVLTLWITPLQLK